MRGTTIVIETEDGQFTLARSEGSRGPDGRPEPPQWFLEVTVNTEGSYGAASLAGEDLRRLANFILSLA